MSQQQDVVERRVVIGRPEKRGLIGKFADGELAVWGLLTLVGIVALFVMPVAMGLPVAVLMFCTGLVIVKVPFPPTRNGRTLYRWGPLFARFYTRRQQGRDKWTNDTAERGLGLAEVSPALPTPPGVGALTWLQVTRRAGDQLAVVISPETRSMTAALRVAGTPGGISDTEEYEAFLDSYDALLGQLANSEGFCSRIAMVSRCVPTDPEAHARYVRQRGSGTAPRTVIESYDVPDVDMASVSDSYTHLLVVHIRLDRAVARAAAAHADGDEGFALLMLGEVEDVAQQLSETGITVLGAASVADTAAFARNSYEPDRPIDDPTATPRTAWPRSSRNAAHALEVGVDPSGRLAPSWVHATAWAAQGPLHPVAPTFLAPLTVQLPGVVRTIAVVKELVPADQAIEQTLGDYEDDKGSSSRRSQLGKTADPRDSQQADRMQQRMDELAAGAAGTEVAVWVSVSARDYDQLDRARRQVSSAAGRAHCRLEWLDREHDRGIVNVLPFARGLK